MLDLQKFSRALRLRWLWHSWQEPPRPWVGSETPCDASDHALFNAATTVIIGNGQTASFWHTNWLGSAPLKLCFPNLFAHSRRKNRTVAQAIAADQWIADLAHGDTSALLHDAVSLHRQIQQQQITLQADVHDQVRWNFEGSGKYSSRSAYALQFLGSATSQFRSLIWDTWAPAKLKIFAWLLHQDRLWCNDRLQRRGWNNSYFCQLCRRNLESAEHLFWECSFTKAIWTNLATWQHCQALQPATWSQSTSSLERVATMVETTQPEFRKGIKSLVMLALWEVWQARNNCTFRDKEANVREVLSAVRRNLSRWQQCGIRFFQSPFGDPP